jgi:hypothetical protein
MQLLAQNMTGTMYQWNSSGWVEGSYILRVRCYSLDFDTTVKEDTYDNGTLYDVHLNAVDDPPTSYWPGDFSTGYSAVFDAGDVPPVTPTTTTTTTTTTGVGPSTPIDPLLIGFLAALASVLWFY